jgi:hypothetical protein
MKLLKTLKIHLLILIINIFIININFSSEESLNKTEQNTPPQTFSLFVSENKEYRFPREIKTHISSEDMDYLSAFQFFLLRKKYGSPEITQHYKNELNKGSSSFLGYYVQNEINKKNLFSKPEFYNTHIYATGTSTPYEDFELKKICLGKYRDIDSWLEFYENFYKNKPINYLLGSAGDIGTKIAQTFSFIKEHKQEKNIIVISDKQKYTLADQSCLENERNYNYISTNISKNKEIEQNIIKKQKEWENYIKLNKSNEGQKEKINELNTCIKISRDYYNELRLTNIILGKKISYAKQENYSDHINVEENTEKIFSHINVPNTVPQEKFQEIKSNYIQEAGSRKGAFPREIDAFPIHIFLANREKMKKCTILY